MPEKDKYFPKGKGMSRYNLGDSGISVVRSGDLHIAFNEDLPRDKPFLPRDKPLFERTEKGKATEGFSFRGVAKDTEDLADRLRVIIENEGPSEIRIRNEPISAPPNSNLGDLNLTFAYCIYTK